MSRLSHFSDWDVAEKRIFMNQLVLDAATSNNLPLLYALLGPRISKKEEEELLSYQREIDENEKSMYPEDIKQRLFTVQLRAIDDHRLSMRHQDLTIQNYQAAVDQATMECRKELILGYRTRIKEHLDISLEEAANRPEVQGYIATLTEIFRDNPFVLERLEHLPAFINSLKEKISYSEKRQFAIAGQINVATAMQLETLQQEFEEKRAHHQSAVEMAYGLPGRADWKLHDESLRDMSYAEFQALAHYNANEPNRDVRVTVDNCVDVDGNTVLHLAFYNRSEEMARFLIEGYGADKNKENFKKKTPQQFAGIESRDDPFLSVVFNRDKKRELSPYLAAVQEHLEKYKREVLDSSMILRLFHHWFRGVSRKHQARMAEYQQLQGAIGTAVQLHHDDDVAGLILKLKGMSDRQEGMLFDGLLQALQERETGRLLSPRRSVRRIDSTTSVQNIELLDAYNKLSAKAAVITEERDIAVQKKEEVKAELASVTDAKNTTIRGYEMTVDDMRGQLVAKDATIGELRGELVVKDTVIEAQQRQLVLKDEAITQRDQALTKLAEAYQMVSTQNSMLQQAVAVQGTQLEFVRGQNDSLKQIVAEQGEHIQSQDQKMQSQNDKIQSQATKLSEQAEDILGLKSQVGALLKLFEQGQTERESQKQGDTLFGRSNFHK